jgi:glc operon protein GlcG
LRRLTNEGAQKMMATAIDEARKGGIAVSVAIADAGGHLILLERLDGGRFHSMQSATTKAVSAASNKRPTSPRGAAGQELDVSHAIGLALAVGPERWTTSVKGELRKRKATYVVGRI